MRGKLIIYEPLAFFWLDGFAVPAPAQVTQAVGRLALNKYDEIKS
jgi:hypothetical protein